jgi:hypothetical protein
MPENFYPFHFTAEERADAVAAARFDPAWAGEMEFASWRGVLMLERDMFCPGERRRHDERPVAVHGVNVPNPDPLGYFSVCAVCGHHSTLPF